MCSGRANLELNPTNPHIGSGNQSQAPPFITGGIPIPESGSGVTSAELLPGVLVTNHLPSPFEYGGLVVKKS